MRARFTEGRGAEFVIGDVLVPIDSPGFDLPPPIDLNDLLVLDGLSVSQASVTPFQEVDVSWSVSAKAAGTELADFVFTLVTGQGVPIDDVGPSGTQRITVLEPASVMIQARKRSGGNRQRIGEGVSIAVDDTACQKIEFDQRFIDAVVFKAVEELQAGEARIRPRTAPDPNSVGPQGFPTQTIELVPSATWHPGFVDYEFPLRFVIDNFFDADLDLRARLLIGVDHGGAQPHLDVTMKLSGHVDFDTVADIVSTGKTAVIAKTLNKVLPLVLECRRGAAERALLTYLGMWPAIKQAGASGKRLHDARIRSTPSGGILEITFCEPPGPPPGPIGGDTPADL